VLPGLEGFLAPSRPDSDRAEADAAKTAFLQAFQRPAYSGAGMQIRGAASLADVPYWRKLDVHLTEVILPLMRLFLKPKTITKADLSPVFSI
jgi:hypothetical protein